MSNKQPALLTIERRVNPPGHGHFSTLNDAKLAAGKGQKYIMYLPNNGYRPASYRLKGYIEITHRYRGGWVRRTDAINRGVFQ